MKIEDCKTVNEFFGVEAGSTIWIEGKRFTVLLDSLVSQGTQAELNAHTENWFETQAGQTLVGCLTGQLEWSAEKPMTEEEEGILREIAAWFPTWVLIELRYQQGIRVMRCNDTEAYPFSVGYNGSKAYEVLAPILEKYGEINLEDYR